ncbi:hypothetical protein H8K52_09305 [Undibacterium seohonense]|uniref:FecR protein domain-containing protein n=1 Tax=Undibacterium seohonense TaxID=1344950 RepID=A0ABR6X3W5_9BURK|nr:DUF6600 domain-containing protein [Undibacterium seohonense]MBC3807540.1 hypothetical protein [Undibacterium seohonense]
MNMLQFSKKICSFTALTVSACLPFAYVAAQSSPPPNSSINTQNEQNDEPPSRIARVGYSFGNISFADAGSNEWVPLLSNRPISTGDSVSVPDGGRAELQVGANALRLHERTRISFINLNDDSTQIQLSQGSLVVRVRALQERENFEINTPNLSFSIQEPGEYRINVNDDNTSTVIIRRGVGVAQGDRDIITLREGEQTRFSGTNLNHTQIVRVPPFDTFDQWAADRDRAEDNSISARYVPRDMVGYQQLDEYGNWDTHNEYGAIWYPRGISVGWAPYRDGKWVWVAPWGWTWIDRSPWGFAPYHYGRWAYVGKRWGWVPGRYERHHRPVYAPALVAWVGVGSGGLNAGINLNTRHTHGPSVSWLPLGPGEVYRPHYTRSNRYIQNMNQTIVINNTTVIHKNDRKKHDDNNYRDYRNQHVQNAVTSVPTQTFVRGEHVFPASSTLRGSDIKHMRIDDDVSRIAPEKNNRFGDARPRNWQENDQFRARPVITGPNRSDAIKLNDGNTDTRYDGNRNNNRDNYRDNRGLNAPVQTQIPSPNTVRSTELNNRNEFNGNRFERRQQNETQGLNTPIQAQQPQLVVPNSTGIKTVEEMNIERNNHRIRAERFDPSVQTQRDRFDDSNRAVLNQPRQEPPREIRTTPPINAGMPVSRPVETSDERTVERNGERNFDRINERNAERNERRFERGAERMPERMSDRAQPIQREMPQTPRPEARMPEPKFVAPEIRRETPVKAEKQEREHGNKRESSRDIREQ